MTASSMIVERDRAIFLSDTAILDYDHTVAEFMSKVVPAPRLGIVIAWTGCMCEGGSATIRNWLRTFDKQIEAVAEIPGLAWAVRHKNIEAIANEGSDEDPNITFQIAVHVRQERRFEGWIVSTDGKGLHPSYEPGTYVQVHECIRPGIGHPVAHPFDVQRDGRMILERQRALVSPGGYYFVGGAGEATIFDRKGVRRLTLCRWNDEVGKRIEAGRDPMSKCAPVHV